MDTKKLRRDGLHALTAKTFFLNPYKYSSTCALRGAILLRAYLVVGVALGVMLGVVILGSMVWFDYDHGQLLSGSIARLMGVVILVIVGMYMVDRYEIHEEISLWSFVAITALFCWIIVPILCIAEYGQKFCKKIEWV